MLLIISYFLKPDSIIVCILSQQRPPFSFIHYSVVHNSASHLTKKALELAEEYFKKEEGKKLNDRFIKAAFEILNRYLQTKSKT